MYDDRHNKVLAENSYINIHWRTGRLPWPWPKCLQTISQNTFKSFTI